MTPGDAAAAIRIGGRAIGPGDPCYVIAEAGVNHNGDLDMARRLIVEAKRAGADCVKFQTFAAERVASAAAPKAPYQLRTTDRAESQLEMLRKLELDAGMHQVLMAACRAEGITFMSTPYSVEDVDLLEQLGVAGYKVPSALLVEPDLLRRIARTGKPMIVSTGLATLAEVEEAVAAIRAAGNHQIILLQCTTDYPARVSDANLRTMRTMSEALDVLTGYSDHTQTPTTAIAAVAMGAVVIEKHFTLDTSLPGPDQATSADPEQFRALVDAIRETESALGNGVKEPSDSERANLIGMRRSLVARRAIAAGEVMTGEMLAYKRPATGIPPRHAPAVVGRTAKRAIAADAVLEWGMFE